MTALRLLAHSPVDAQLSYFQFLDENSMISKKAYRSSLLRLLLQWTVPSPTCFSKFAEPTALWSWTQCAFDFGSKDSVPLLIKCPSALTHSFCFCMALNPILIWVLVQFKLWELRESHLSKLTYNHIPMKSPWADDTRVAVSTAQTSSFKFSSSSSSAIGFWN